MKGKPGSEFIVIVIQDGTLKYYNFENNLFELGHTSKNNLKITMSNSSSYKHTVDFPSGGGTYVIKVVAEEGTVVKNNKKIISKNIEKQSSTTTITLKPATVNTDNYSTFATVASTGSVGDGAVLTGSFLVNNASTDVGGHGLKINTDKFGKWQATQQYGLAKRLQLLMQMAYLLVWSCFITKQLQCPLMKRPKPWRECISWG